MNDPRMDLFNVSLEGYDRVHQDEDCWVHDWTAKHERGRCTEFHTSVTAVGAVLKRRIELPGVVGAMVQTITLLAHEPRIIFETYFQKSEQYDPEAIYLAFPFLLKNAQAWYETAGQAVAFDKQQLPGVCRDWVTTDSYLAVAGDGSCITLASPDVPLFQIGGLHFGRGHKDAEGLNQATLFAWPMNNYWNTNYRAAQPGFIRLCFELTTAPAFDPAACNRFAASACHPVIWHPVAKCAGDQQQPLIHLEGKDVTLAQVKCSAEQGHGVVVRLHNHAAQIAEARLTLPSCKIQSACMSDTLERETGTALEIKDNWLSVRIPARSTATVLLHLAHR